MAKTIKFMRKADFYKSVKTIGLVTFIPFTLAAGPLSGYFLGDFIQKKFNLPFGIVLFSIAVGFISGAMEVVRILKVIARMDKK